MPEAAVSVLLSRQYGVSTPSPTDSFAHGSFLPVRSLIPRAVSSAVFAGAQPAVSARHRILVPRSGV